MKRFSNLDKYVIFTFLCLIIYTIASQLIAYRTGETNDTLTTCFFAVFGGEVLTCALIKIFKLKDVKSDDQGGIQG